MGRTEKMTSIEELDVLIRARYPLIYVITWEEARVEEVVAEFARRREKKIFVWTASRGIHPQGAPAQSKKGSDEATQDPLVALDHVLQMVEPAIYIFKDLHRFTSQPIVARRLRDLATHLKNSYKTVILTAPTLEVPQELEKEVTVVDFDLPSAEELGLLLERTIREVNENTNMRIEINDSAKEKILRASLGLTLTEAENVFAKTLVVDGKLDDEDIPIILSEKEQIIRKSGLLEFFRAEERITDVGGLDVLKDWMRKRTMAFTEEAKRFGLPAPKGILMIGVQGCGKSLCAKAAASLWQMPLLRLDMGRMFSSLVGSSEENMRKAIQVAESVAPALLWIDEIEKAFAGSQSSSFSDAGTTSRVFGGFMTWLQEKTSPVFVVATANEISQLPPELLRKGRFDEIFFVDLPGPREREEIFAIHLKLRSRDPGAFDLPLLAELTEGFSGAEIEQAVVSALFDAFASKSDLTTEFVASAARESIPLSRTMKEPIEKLRSWADGRARPASLPPEDVEEAPADIGRRRLEVD